jgi:hypothetical protein
MNFFLYANNYKHGDSAKLKIICDGFNVIRICTGGSVHGNGCIIVSLLIYTFW